MAWYAELKRRHWYKIVELDMRWEYKLYDYNTWYNSLTDEEKQRYEELKQKKREQHDKEFKDLLEKWAFMTGKMLEVAAKVESRRNYEKYHGVYDENGYPVI